METDPVALDLQLTGHSVVDVRRAPLPLVEDRFKVVQPAPGRHNEDRLRQGDESGTSAT